jgi:hypothetical protein
METEKIRSFFLKLSMRFWKENHLSDVTWALGESCPAFRVLFINFFFEEFNETASVSLQREYLRGCSRPDFFFKIGKEEYIIEVKKADSNYHFDQYRRDFPYAHFGWIANYRLSPVTGVEVRTWPQFSDYLENHISESSIEPGWKAIINCYCSYLQSVCSIVKFRKMSLDNLSSLYLFNKMIEKIITESCDGLHCSLYTQSRGTWEDRSGKHFTLSKVNPDDKKVYPWFGIYYNQVKTCICIGFSQPSCKSVYDGVETFPMEGGKYYIEPYRSENSYWFELADEHFVRFNQLESAEQQEIMLKEYFAEVLHSVNNYL